MLSAAAIFVEFDILVRVTKRSLHVPPKTTKYMCSRRILIGLSFLKRFVTTGNKKKLSRGGRGDFTYMCKIMAGFWHDRQWVNIYLSISQQN